MPKYLPRLLMILALLASASAASAQTERPWVDPPSEAGAQAQPPVPSVTTRPESTRAADPPPVAASPGPASNNAREQAVESEEASRSPAPSADLPSQPEIKNQPSKNAVAGRKMQSPSRRTAASPKASRRSEALASRRAPSTRASVAVSRSLGRSPTGSRSARVGRPQGGANSRLEVMNLRTIQFPDGRRISILTRPDPGAMPELMRPPGY